MIELRRQVTMNMLEHCPDFMKMQYIRKLQDLAEELDILQRQVAFTATSTTSEDSPRDLTPRTVDRMTAEMSLGEIRSRLDENSVPRIPRIGRPKRSYETSSDEEEENEGDDGTTWTSECVEEVTNKVNAPPESESEDSSVVFVKIDWSPSKMKKETE